MQSLTHLIACMKYSFGEDSHIARNSHIIIWSELHSNRKSKGVSGHGQPRPVHNGHSNNDLQHGVVCPRFSSYVAYYSQIVGGIIDINAILQSVATVI